MPSPSAVDRLCLSKSNDHDYEAALARWRARSDEASEAAADLAVETAAAPAASAARGGGGAGDRDGAVPLMPAKRARASY